MSYFKTLRFWYLDLIVCYAAATFVTPADPMSHIIMFVPIFAVWLTIRVLIARRLSR